MNKRLELTGEIYGKLTVQWFSHIGPGGSYWVCKCECGTIKPVSANNLRRGKIVSCGCVYKQALGSRTRTHGMSKHLAYPSWKSMMHRCYSEGHEGYHLYGGRGISVSPGWHTFEGFWEDMRAGWRRNLTLDRINPDGNYEVSNCRWATPREQAVNRRNNRIVETPAGPMVLSLAAEKYKISYKTITDRLRAGKTDLNQIFAPTKRRKRTPTT